MKALVTGASGFVGFNLVKLLQEQGHEVKALARSKPPEHLEKLGVPICRGDLTDADSLQKALVGCDHLFHVAAHYTLWEKDPQIFYRINVDGTKKLMQIAAESGVEKIVYTSSVAAIKPPSDTSSSNEETPTKLEDIVGHYKRSKFLGEQAVVQLAEEEKIPVVIVNPSAPIGPYDVKPTPTGKIIIDFLQGKMPAYIRTGLNLVGVEDVALGHILAAEKGQIGRRYILGNQNMYLIDILRTIAKLSGKKAPKIRMPYGVAYTASLFSEGFARITGQTPGIPLDAVKMARKLMFYDNTRAVEELGFQPTDVDGAIERAMKWFLDNDYV